MQYITDPDMEMIYEINARRKAEKADTLRKCQARVAHEKAKRAFWRTVRRAALECGSCLCLAGMMAVYTARDMVFHGGLRPYRSGLSHRRCVAWCHVLAAA